MMKKSLFFTVSILLLILIISNVCFGMLIYPPRTFLDTYKDLNQDNPGQCCYIFGSFSLVHTLDPTLADPAVAGIAENVDRSSQFFLKMQMKNTDTNQTTVYYFKPVTGSNTKVYYPNSDKKLEENAKDPYWVAKLPEGSYELTNVSCSYLIKKQSFQSNQFQLFETPIVKLFNKKITFATGVKQFVYIGDYSASLVTNVFVKNLREIYPYYKFDIALKDDFENAKAKFLGNAYERVKEKLKGYTFISIL